MRLAALVTHPVQYFAPVFRELAQQPNLDFKVFFGCNHGLIPTVDTNFGVSFKWDCEPTTGFDHEFLSVSPLSSLHGLAGASLAAKTVASIDKYQPDAVLIFSYTPTFITFSTFLLRLAGYTLMLRAETTETALSRSDLKDNLPIGTNSINHYLKMGVDKSQLSVVQYSIDVDFFQKFVDDWLPRRESLRLERGIQPEDTVFIYCGKMSLVKNPLIIPEAIEKLSLAEKSRVWLLAVGDGILRPEFESISKTHLGERAIFVGFKNQSELGQYYAMADVLILPSQSGETWGLVVNEALQFGLRVIVSDIVGSGRDLIRDTDDGWIFPAGDVNELATAISQSINTHRLPPRSLEELPHPRELARAVYRECGKL
jgi:glycosyltransferase involved in cell wall biosynthesis